MALSKKDQTKKIISNIHQKRYKFISFVHYLKIKLFSHSFQVFHDIVKESS